jgi:ubiquinone biosynthesis O-methyltransferase
LHAANADKASMNEQEQAGAFPELGPEAYVRWRASDLGAITERLERDLILQFVGDVRGRKVLDIGCGDGELSLVLAKRGAAVTGIDVSGAMIDAARARAKRHDTAVAFEIAQAEKLPFQADQFDMVTAITILCFVKDAGPVFREISRVLRPGGLLVIGELGKWSIWAARRRIRAWLGSPLWRRGHFRTASELRDLAQSVGLDVQAVRGAIFYPPSGGAARLLHPLDPALGRLGTFGAAFVALAATKR